MLYTVEVRIVDLDTMALLDSQHGSYGELLLRPEWKQKREVILHRDNHTCQFCGSRENLQVHHRQYHYIERLCVFKMPWEYPSECLITICQQCHNRGHASYDVPTIIY